MSDLFDKTVEYVDKSFGKIFPHFDRTVYWMKVLNPEADEALLIAAYSHDIDRSTWKTTFRSKVFLQDKESNKKHQEHGGEIMEKFLLKNNANRALAERVKYLISKHEDGGDKDQNLLKDADSISYMEINAPKHVGRLGEFTADEIRTKFDNMYDRISSEEAKKLAKPLYDKAINQLLAASKKKNK